MAEAPCTNFTHHETPAHSGARGFGRHGILTKRMDERRSGEDRRTTDASRLTFPIQMVLLIGASVASATGAVWTMNMTQRAAMLSMASDVRDIKTTMDGLTRYQGSQIDTLRRDYDTMLREQALQRVRLEETRNSLAKIEGLLTNVAGIKK